jgi:N-terminal 7TM region of histidine kinase
MSGQGWNFLAFVITILIAAFSWWLAWLAYSHSKKSYLHRTLAFTLLFFGLWIASGWVKKIFFEPSDAFTTFTYHWAYVAGMIALTSYALIALTFYLGKKSPAKYSLPIIMAGAVCALLSATPLVIKSASYRQGESFFHQGPLHFLVIGFSTAIILLTMALNLSKFFSSTGIERAQSTLRLLGLGVLFTLVPTLAFIIPAITATQVTTQYAFFVALVPLSLDFYVIMRHRFLDIRIILRKTGLCFLIAIVFALPVLLSYIFFSALHFQLWQERLCLLVLILALVLIAPIVPRHAILFSSQRFFSDIFDEAELLKRINSDLLSESYLPETLLSVLSKIASSLALSRSQIAS